MFLFRDNQNCQYESTMDFDLFINNMCTSVISGEYKSFIFCVYFFNVLSSIR